MLDIDDIDYGFESIQIVRCNQCMHIFPEEAILVEDEVEYCPDCDETGCLMDMGIYGEEDDKILFPYLSQAKEWEWLKKHFLVHLLCDFENEIRDIKGGIQEVEDYPLIYQWWEGLVDNKELDEHYQGI